MNLSRFVFIFWLPLVAAPHASTRAQVLSVNPFTLDGGGGTSSSSNGLFRIDGTLGQPDAGRMSGGPFSVLGGFWSMVSIVPTGGAPKLTVEREAKSNALIVSWPSPSSGWRLEQNQDLTQGTWKPMNQPPVDDGARNLILINPPVGQVYFRLTKP